MIFIGDVHGEFKTYLYVLQKMQHKGGVIGVDCSLQLGDMGIGFPKGERNVVKKDGKSWLPELDLEHKFIRGNHDNPAMCKRHPNYAGDWKYFRSPDIFAVSGGYSIDYIWRIKDKTWWEEEELNDSQLEQMFRDYKQHRPRIVVSHECPTIVKEEVATNREKLKTRSRTEKKLQEMYEHHQPELWIFGHHHKKLELDAGDVHFVGLGELVSGVIHNCIYNIDGLKW